MATFSPFSGGTPAKHYTHRITEVAAGDQIDIEEILGPARAARGVKFFMTATTDTVEYKLNNLQRLPRHLETTVDETVKIWSSAPHFSVFSDTGALEHTTEDGILVSSIEIVSLTLSVGTEIDLVIW